MGEEGTDGWIHEWTLASFTAPSPGTEVDIHPFPTRGSGQAIIWPRCCAFISPQCTQKSCTCCQRDRCLREPQQVACFWAWYAEGAVQRKLLRGEVGSFRPTSHQRQPTSPDLPHSLTYPDTGSSRREGTGNPSDPRDFSCPMQPFHLWH